MNQIEIHMLSFYTNMNGDQPVSKYGEIFHEQANLFSPARGE